MPRGVAPPDAPSSEGFTEYEFSLVVPPGEDLGVEFSLESPHLEIPVVIDICDRGCFAVYNASDPEYRIEVGDAVIEASVWHVPLRKSARERERENTQHKLSGINGMC